MEIGRNKEFPVVETLHATSVLQETEIPIDKIISSNIIRV